MIAAALAAVALLLIGAAAGFVLLAGAVERDPHLDWTPRGIRAAVAVALLAGLFLFGFAGLVELAP